MYQIVEKMSDRYNYKILADGYETEEEAELDIEKIKEIGQNTRLKHILGDIDITKLRVDWYMVVE